MLDIVTDSVYTIKVGPLEPDLVKGKNMPPIEHKPFRNLDELHEYLVRCPHEYDDNFQRYLGEWSEEGVARGLTMAHGEIDSTAFPTFGGEPLEHTEEVYSWDPTRILQYVGGNWSIRPRD